MNSRSFRLVAAGIVVSLAGCSGDDSTVAPTPQPSSDRYVNVATGDDANDGSSDSPWKTVTHAVATADSQIVVHVGPGIYDDASGEVFPIALKYGQTLLGNVSSKGAGLEPIVIRGEGPYLPRTYLKIA